MKKEESSKEKGDIRANVREHYGKFAAEFTPTGGGGCCSGDTGSSTTIPLTSLIYDTPDVQSLPEEVTGLAAGCGDPITLASLQEGETVLDLGSGGGIDCFMAAKRVGETGHVIGVDMTAEMIEKARRNKSNLGAKNVEFRLGEIEHLPVADETIDVVISNCVINLSPDKPQVIRDTYRVLRSGGRIAVSDIVTDGPLPQVVQDSLAAWAGCVAGALDYREYQAILEDAGFIDIEITPVELEASQIEGLVEQCDCGSDVSVGEGDDRKAYYMVDGELTPLNLGGAKPPFSARITARKPE
jgi:ubiquinone/menaquinone biosynthesis C-methylase UbiE